MKADRSGARHDWTTEQIEDAERQAHEDFLCDPVFCIYCQEERDLEELISYTLEQLEKEK